MNSIKILLLVGIALIVVVGSVGLSLPNEIEFERTLKVKAPKELVWDELNSLDALHNWCPWMELDPNVAIEFDGNSGSVGSIKKWKGNNVIGSGEERIMQISDSSITTQTRYFKPIQLNSTSTICISEVQDGVEIKWDFKTDAPFPSNLMYAVIDLKGLLSSDFERGLKKLETRITEKVAQN